MLALSLGSEQDSAIHFLNKTRTPIRSADIPHKRCEREHRICHTTHITRYIDVHELIRAGVQ
eukprot:1488903-Prymnesium_polylepis.1